MIPRTDSGQFTVLCSLLPRVLLPSPKASWGSPGPPALGTGLPLPWSREPWGALIPPRPASPPASASPAARGGARTTAPRSAGRPPAGPRSPRTFWGSPGKFWGSWASSVAGHSPSDGSTTLAPPAAPQRPGLRGAACTSSRPLCAWSPGPGHAEGTRAEAVLLERVPPPPPRLLGRPSPRPPRAPRRKHLGLRSRPPRRPRETRRKLRADWEAPPLGGELSRPDPLRRVRAAAHPLPGGPSPGPGPNRPCPPPRGLPARPPAASFGEVRAARWRRRGREAPACRPALPPGRPRAPEDLGL